MSIKSIRIKNLRSIVDSGCISIKPLTILVGKNSSGKSSFARSFPLLRQSLEREIRGPILWWGRFVDFGEYKVAVNRNNAHKGIDLEYKVVIEESNLKHMLASGILNSLNSNNHQFEFNVDVAVVASNQDESDYTSQITLSLHDVTICIFFQANGFITKITTDNYEWNNTNETIYCAQNQLFPRLHLWKNTGEEFENFNMFFHELKNHIGENLVSLMEKAEINDLLNMPLSASKHELKKQLHTLLLKYDISMNFTNIDKLFELSILSKLNTLLDYIRKEIIDFYQNVIYLEPLRFNSQRYYRQQSISIDEMDSRGENIAMFIKSMDRMDMNKFQRWTEENLGFKIYAQNHTGHVSLEISYKDNETKENITDVGFGISQMLPIIMQLWSAKYLHRRNKIQSSSKILVIEQPELHLHPKFQAKMSDVIVQSLKLRSDLANEKSIQLIIETHSQPLINRIGELIYTKQIDSNDVQVILFDKDENKVTNLKISNFNEDGVLENWPFDFFDSSNIG